MDIEENIKMINKKQFNNNLANNKSKEERKIISLLEMFILIIGAIAFAWIVGGYQEIPIPIENKIINGIVKSLDIIPSVSAQAIGNSGKCCVSTKNGLSCQNLASNVCDSQCNGGCLSTSCDQVIECKLGCSIDTQEGLCTPNSLKSQCESTNNCNWVDDSSCNTAECNKGCCNLGLNRQYITEQSCKKQSQLLGLTMGFDPGKNEAECIDSLGEDEKGACVYGDEEDGKRLCRFTTKVNCQTNSGEFHKNYLCSNTELKTVCEKQKSTNCVDGLDGVYWFDSCGNIENIYSSDKSKSWNNGIVATPNSICSSPGSTCGNCNYELGSKCGLYRAGVDTKLRDGDYTCRDLNCKNAPGNAETKKDRINGESWCVYDGQIGGINLIPLPSADPVGSRHFRYICENGEVKSEPCADYRKEICVQDTKTLSNGKKIDNALCRVNMYEACLAANGEKGCEGECLVKCMQNPDCRLFPVMVDTDFKFNECVPKYPPGFDLGKSSGITGIVSGAIGNQLGDIGGLGESAGGLLGGLNGEGSDSSQICGLGSKTCTVIYQKLGIPPLCKWKVIKNEKCESISFTEQMNNLCVSIGDCGAYTNIAGKVTAMGASVSKKGSKGHAPPSPFLIAFQYIIFANPIAGQKAEPGFFDNVLAINDLGNFGISNIFGNGYARVGGGGGSGGLFSSGQLGGTLAGGVGIVGITSTVGLGLLPETGSLLTGIFPGFGINPYLLGVVIVYMVLSAISGCGKIENVEIKFECKPWTRPSGGDGGLFAIVGQSEGVLSGLAEKGCGFCNKDKLKPCTKYRCESLGMRCRLINENTGQDTCIYDDRKVGIPIITPWEEILNKTMFSYKNISTNGFQVRNADGSCIQAFTILSFGVLTDEYALCKISEENSKFEEMEGYFLEQQLFTKNHTSITNLPSVDSIIASETNNVDEFNLLRNNQTVYTYLLNKVGDINLHVKCANIDGQANDIDYRINFCVAPGPDLTSPIIMATSPPENAIVAYSATEQFSVMFVNEPSECKWDKIKPETTNMTLAYQQLANTMSCETNVNSGTLLGYPCNATLPIYGDESKYYILCRDQPWLGENDSRNYGAKNGGVYEYKLLKSESALKIDSILPSGNITEGVEPITIEISAQTSGGANGNAECRYKLNNYPGLVDMMETGGSTHKTVLNQMIRGDYTLTINCTDIAGNNAEDFGTFKLELDTLAPEVTRIYYQSGNLVVLTNEDSECAYVRNDSLCGFSFENGIKMESSLSEVHTAEWESNEIYDILCRDNFGNHVGGCSAIIQPRTFPTAT